MLSARSLQRSQLLHEQTYEMLRSAILSGELAAGSRLIETQLAEQLQVSRTPIREALRLLQRDHLVTVDAQGAMRVALLSIEDAIQLYDCRIALEQLSVSAACRMATPEQLEQIESTLQQAERAILNSSHSLTPYQLLHLDYQFHRLLAESSDNTWLVQILDQVFDKMSLLRLRTIEHNPNVLEIRGEHRRILEAIRKRDALAAMQAIQYHLISSKDRVVEEIQALDQHSLEPSENSETF
ncbi:GntR family transcriptional regulator [Leptolyngbya sp. NIES-2104]|uniref:GntR family transcriptional regulator n=1 Tax=Leptolyngbya sp. NIES-2104 TaxID=1552121 RepID=UPI0006EC5D60|nr:GntR family transcriptional regulator [Leptolyngbya sp. NIES-2104]GAP94530.1 transcriptional regulator, GntR family [Leptolyngbya sp. NIES-2104]